MDSNSVPSVPKKTKKLEPLSESIVFDEQKIGEIVNLCKNKTINMKSIEKIFPIIPNEDDRVSFAIKLRENIDVTIDERIDVLRMFKDPSIKSRVAIVLFLGKKVSNDNMLKIKEMFIGTDQHFFIMHAFAKKMKQVTCLDVLRRLALNLTETQKGIYYDELKKYNIINVQISPKNIHRVDVTTKDDMVTVDCLIN
jgi:hypothetical protein